MGRGPISRVALATLLAAAACASDTNLPEVDLADGRCTRRDGDPEVSGPCALSVLTYNVHGISSWLINLETHGDERYRSASLGWLARDYDLVLLQEDFEYHARIFEGPALAFVEQGTGPRATMMPLKLLAYPLYWFQFRAPYGSGLTMAAPALQPSKLEGDDGEEREDGVLVKARLPTCNGWFGDGSDCFSTKGVLGMRLLLRNGAEIDVYTTHLDAGRGADDRKARRRQLRRIAKKIEKKSAGRAVILAGDLNMEHAPAPSNPPVPDPPGADGNPPNPDYQILYEELIEPLGLRDTGAREKGSHFGDPVDWVLYRSSPEPAAGEDPPPHRVDVQVVAAGEDERFRHPVNRGVPEKTEDHKGVLSDHPALGVCFAITRLAAGETPSATERSPAAPYLCARGPDAPGSAG